MKEDGPRDDDEDIIAAGHIIIICLRRSEGVGMGGEGLKRDTIVRSFPYV